MSDRADKTLEHLEALSLLVQERGDKSQLDLTDAVSEILPKLVTEENAHNLFKLAEDSAAVDDKRLSEILTVDLQQPFQEYERREAMEPAGVTRYYIRSITLSRDEYSQILDQYADQYHDPTFLQRNREYLESKKPEDTISIRYVGCTSVATSLQRYWEDERGRSHSRYANLRKVMRTHGTGDMSVYEIPCLSIKGRYGDFKDPNRCLIDQTEQVLIHLLGRDLLLNSQPGGFYHYFTPATSDIEIIRLLPLDLSRQYIQSSSNDPSIAEKKRSEVSNIYEDFRDQLQEKHGKLAATITDSYIEFLSTAANPRSSVIVREYVPITLFARNITAEDFNAHRNFFDGCRPGAATTTLLKHILGVDDVQKISFLDLNVTLNDSADLLDLQCLSAGSALESMHSLTIATFGFLSTAVAYSKFHGRHSLSPVEFGDMVGEPFLTNYDAAFDYKSPPDQEPSDSCWAVVIPHFHLGSLKYGSVEPILFRLALLCWTRSMLLLNCCLELLNSPSETPGSQAFANLLIERLHMREHRTGFPELLAKVRKEVSDWRSKNQTGRYEKSVFRHDSVFSHAYLSARGKAGYKSHQKRHGFVKVTSTDRAIQLAETIRYNTPLLRRCIAMSGGSLNNFKNWFMNLKPQTDIHQAIVRKIQIDFHKPFGGLDPATIQYLRVQCKRPEGFTDDSWMLDPHLVAEAKKDRCSVLWKSHTADWRRKIKLGLLRRLSRFGKGPARYFIEFPINVTRTGKAYFSVEIDGEVISNLYLWVGGDRDMQGPHLLDYDPSINQHALVIKDLQGNLKPSAISPKIFTDAHLLSTRRDTYFKVFANTVALFGLELRPEIQKKVIHFTLFDHKYRALPPRIRSPRRALPTPTQTPPPTSKGKATISDHRPFLEWWRRFHEEDPVGTQVIVKYRGPAIGFWQEFEAIAEEHGPDDPAIRQYLAVKQMNLPQSLNAIAKKYGWGKVHDKPNDRFIWTAPGTPPPEKPIKRQRMKF